MEQEVRELLEAYVSEQGGTVKHAGQPHGKSTPGLASVVEAQAPALWEAERANVLRMATRHKILTIEEATNRLAPAESLGVHSVPNRTFRQGALVRACQSGVAVYDALFVELAARQKLPLATFDVAVPKAFPKVAARRPNSWLDNPSSESFLLNALDTEPNGSVSFDL